MCALGVIDRYVLCTLFLETGCESSRSQVLLVTGLREDHRYPRLHIALARPLSASSEERSEGSSDSCGPGSDLHSEDESE